MKNNDYKNLIAHLYFVEGLEDLRHIGYMKPKYMKEWSNDQGDKFCQIFFALSCGADPKDVLKKLQDDSRTDN